jgi:hypothetical protein
MNRYRWFAIARRQGMVDIAWAHVDDWGAFVGTRSNRIMPFSIRAPDEDDEWI